jgi:uncharacterized protein (DUF4415 family)
MTDTPTKSPSTKSRPAVTFSPEAVQAILDQVAKEREAMAASMAELAALKAQAAKPSAATNGKSDVSAKNDLAVLRTFKRQGFKDIQPRVNVLTFRKWLEHGYRPKEGSKAVKVSNLRLWHVSQVRPLTKEEISEATLKDVSPPKPAKAPAKRSGKGTVIPMTGVPQ